MSKRGSNRDDSDVPRSETGWLDDLKRAKKEGGDLGDATTGGSDRWAKLGALSGDPEPRQPGPPPAGRRGRGEPPAGRRSPEPPPPPPPPPSNRDSAPPRRRPESEMDGERESARETARRLIGRRSRDEDTSSDRSRAAGLIGRRARSEPDTGRRGRDIDADVDTGRRRGSESDFDSGRDTGRDVGRDTGRDVGRDTGRDVGRDTGRDSGRRRAPEPDPGMDTGRRRASDPGDAPARPDPAEGARRRSAFLDRLTDRPGATRGRTDLPPAEGTRGRMDPPSSETRGRHDLPAPDSPAAARGRMPFGRDSRSSSPVSPARGGRHEGPPADEPRGVASKLSRGPGAAAHSTGLPPGGPPPAPPSAGPMPTAPPAAKPGPAMPGSPLPSSPPGPVRPTSPSPGRQRAGIAAGVQAIRGARSEVRRQLREQQRLRMWTLILLVVAVVGALPFYFVLRAATQDPVITSLDALSVPSWAVLNKTDNITGSRWCVLDCRYRERTAESNRPITETAKVYREALLAAGWSQMTHVPGCEPVQEQDSDHSCWRRDEFTLDLSVNEPACMQEALRKRPRIDVTPSATPSASESASPGASPTPSSTAPADDCVGSVVQIKVFNAIDDVRLRWSPEPTLEPEIGNLTDEDLATPSAGPTP